MADVLAALPSRDGDLPLNAISSRQRGLVQTAQLQALGFSPAAIAHRVRRGRLIHRHRGVYLVGHGAESELTRPLAAVLAIDGSVLTHRSALVLWRVVPPTDAPIHVTAPGPRRTRPGIRVHCSNSLTSTGLAAIERIPVTVPARALLDYAEQADSRAVETALNEARAQRLIGPSDLGELRRRTPGRRGWKELGRLLAAERGPDFSRSKAELAALRLIRSASLPIPRRNVQVGGYEVDLLWPEHGLAVEIDSWAFHSDRRSFERDRRKAADLKQLGLDFVALTPRQIRDEPAWVVARIAGALAVTDRHRGGS